MSRVPSFPTILHKKCPSCRHEHDKGVAVCAQCGINFDAWYATIARAEKAPLKESSVYLAGRVLLLLCALVLGFYLAL